MDVGHVQFIAENDELPKISEFMECAFFNCMRDIIEIVFCEWGQTNFPLRMNCESKIARFTHRGQVTHVCVSKITINGSNNGLSPGRREAIFSTTAGILLIGPQGTNFSEILIENHTFSFQKIHLKMLSGKWRPFCFGLNVLMCPCVMHDTGNTDRPVTAIQHTDQGLPSCLWSHWWLDFVAAHTFLYWQFITNKRLDLNSVQLAFSGVFAILVGAGNNLPHQWLRFFITWMSISRKQISMLSATALFGVCSDLLAILYVVVLSLFMCHLFFPYSPNPFESAHSTVSFERYI